MRAAWDLLVRLLFDQRLRAAFEADRAAVILAAGLSPASWRSTPRACAVTPRAAPST